MLDLDPIKARLGGMIALAENLTCAIFLHAATQPTEAFTPQDRKLWEMIGIDDVKLENGTPVLVSHVLDSDHLIANAPADLVALVAEVERLRRALSASENLRSEAARLHQQERERAKQERYEFADERMKLTGNWWKLASAIQKHRDGWHQSENRMLVDRVTMRAAQARELWAVLDA